MSSKSDTLSSISQPWVDFKQTWNKFLDPLVLRVMPSQKYSKKKAFFLLFVRYAAWTGFLNKYQEFDLVRAVHINNILFSAMHWTWLWVTFELWLTLELLVTFELWVSFELLVSFEWWVTFELWVSFESWVRGGQTDRQTSRHTDKHTHQYQDSAWPKGRAEWKGLSVRPIGGL